MAQQLVVVVRDRLHTLICAECGGETTAEWPAGLPVGAFGPHLQAMVSLTEHYATVLPELQLERVLWVEALFSHGLLKVWS